MEKAFVYILRCANGQYYVGSTDNVERRIVEHSLGHGSKFTKAHLPFELVYVEECLDRHAAYVRERQLHGWSRKKKELLIENKL